jgi:hypothetical protein
VLLHLDLGDQRTLPPALQPIAVTDGEERDNIGARVVTGALVLGPGVPEPDRQQIGGRAGTGA